MALLTTADAERKYGIPAETFAQLCRDGKLVASGGRGRPWRIREEDIEEYISNNPALRPLSLQATPSGAQLPNKRLWVILLAVLTILGIPAAATGAVNDWFGIQDRLWPQATTTPAMPVVSAIITNTMPAPMGTLAPTTTPMPASTHVPTPNPVVLATSVPTGISTAYETQLLSSGQWHLEAEEGAAEAYQDIPQHVLQGQDLLRVTYDLHGLYALGGDASAIIFDQNEWQYISLSEYGENGKDGVQTVDIPLSDFNGLDINAPVGTLHTRFWYNSPYKVDIYSINVIGNSPPRILD